MHDYFKNPENALKRSKELLSVGKQESALEVLSSVIKSKHHRNWQIIHQSIIKEYLYLCVILKKSIQAKEGLYQYRNICQNVNIKSFEDAMNGYLTLAEEKTAEARQQSNQAVIDIEELDNILSPENILLSTVSNEDTQAREDHRVLAPWLKFLRESYRQCLELLRNSVQFERLYHDVALKAFTFCFNYNQKMEFKNLGDRLRAHFANMQTNAKSNINVKNPETLNMHLETKLAQLDLAIKMDLWQDAYKNIVAITDLIGISKIMSKPKLMANFYTKLALVFWHTEKYLYHASVLLKHFYLMKEHKKNFAEGEMQRMASKLVLATISIPIAPAKVDTECILDMEPDIYKRNQQFLTKLINFTSVPTKQLLMNEMFKRGIFKAALPEVQAIYHQLQDSMSPSKLWPTISKCLNKLEEDCKDYSQYFVHIKELALVHLLILLPQVYDRISIKRVNEMLPYLEELDIERMINYKFRSNNLQVFLDAQQGCLVFNPNPNDSSILDLEEGPKVQNLPSTKFMGHITKIFKGMSKFNSIIDPSTESNKVNAYRAKLVETYQKTWKREHKSILERKHKIEKKKEDMENKFSIKEEEARKVLEEKQHKLQEAEKERIAREIEERNKARLEKERSDMQKKVMKEKIETIMKTKIGAQLCKKYGEELENLNPQELMNRQVAELDKEEKDKIAKLVKLSKKIDHLERAKRIEEIPLLKEKYEKDRAADIEQWEKAEAERVAFANAEYTSSLEHKKRLTRTLKDKAELLELVKEKYSRIYESDIAKFEETKKAERAKRLIQRSQKRKEQRRDQYLQEIEDERQEKIRQEEEEAARLIEEERKAKEKEEAQSGPWKPRSLRPKQEEREETEDKPQEDNWRSGGKTSFDDRSRNDDDRRDRDRRDNNKRDTDDVTQSDSQPDDWRANQPDRSQRDSTDIRRSNQQDRDQSDPWRTNKDKDPKESDTWRSNKDSDTWRSNKDRDQKESDTRKPSNESDTWRSNKGDQKESEAMRPNRDSTAWRSNKDRDQREPDTYNKLRNDEPKQESKPADEIPERSSQEAWRKPADDVPERSSQDAWRKPADEEKTPWRSARQEDRPTESNRNWNEDRPPRRQYGGREDDNRPIRRDFNERSDRGSGRDFSDRSERSGGRDFGDRSERSGGRDFGDRSERGGRDFGDRSDRGGGRDFGDRGGRDFGERGGRDFGDRSDRGGGRDDWRNSDRRGTDRFSERRTTDFRRRDEPRDSNYNDRGFSRGGGRDEGRESTRDQPSNWRNNTAPQQENPTSKQSDSRGGNRNEDEGWTTVVKRN